MAVAIEENEEYITIIRSSGELRSLIVLTWPEAAMLTVMLASIFNEEEEK